MKTISILTFLMISLSTFGQENQTFLKNWKSYSVPTDEDTLSKYNWSPNDWVVYSDKDDVRVGGSLKYKGIPEDKLPFKIRQSNGNITNIAAPLCGLIDVEEVDDGYLTCFNRGEYGGELYWFSKDGKKRYKISGHQIVQFIKRDYCCCVNF